MLRFHLASFAYCAVLAALNWWHSTSSSGPTGSSQETVAPVMFAVLLSAAIVLALVGFCLWKARARLERGSRVAPGRWVQTYLPVAYALPLLFHYTTSATSVAGDGVRTIVSGGYGHDLSLWVFLLAVAGMLLAQVAIRLSDTPPSSGETGVVGQFVRI